MPKVMLYRHPKTINSNDVNKGFTKVKGVEFDWIIVDDKEVEACIEQGFYRNTDDALGANDEETTTTQIKSELKSLEEFEGDKDALETYGIKLGINLSKRKSIENMYKDLVEFMEMKDL